MKTYVINLNKERQRWAGMQQHLRRDLGIEPVRWPATSVASIVVEGDWSEEYPVFDKPRRIAILRTYRALLEHLDKEPEDQWLILQDDIRFTRHPDRDNEAPIFLYGGYTLTFAGGERRVCDPTRNFIHVCPRAFRLHRDMIWPLHEAWSDETVQSCVSWSPLLTPETTGFDMPPSLMGDDV